MRLPNIVYARSRHPWPEQVVDRHRPPPSQHAAAMPFRAFLRMDNTLGLVLTYPAADAGAMSRAHVP